MDELGISDVDDISDLSDSPSRSGPPPVPATPPPKASQPNNDDWDTSAMSDLVSTPRPGILKKWNNVCFFHL